MVTKHGSFKKTQNLLNLWLDYKRMLKFVNYKYQIDLAQICFGVIIQHLPFLCYFRFDIETHYFLIQLHLFSNTYIHYYNYFYRSILHKKACQIFLSVSSSSLKGIWNVNLANAVKINVMIKFWNMYTYFVINIRVNPSSCSSKFQTTFPLSW